MSDASPDYADKCEKCGVAQSLTVNVFRCKDGRWLCEKCLNESIDHEYGLDAHQRCLDLGW